MGNAQDNDSPAKDNSSARGLPQPLGWMSGFISKNFSKMPQTIQIVVFLAFVGYFMFATLRLLWPLMFPPEYIEIRGEVIGTDCSPLPDSLVRVEFSGEGLFVYKKPVGLGDKFTYEWILKVPRTKIDEKLWFALTMFNPELRRPVILASESFSPDELKQQQDSDGKVHLVIDNPVTRIAIASCKTSDNPATGISMTDFLINSALAAPAQKLKRNIPRDSVNQLIHDYGKLLNPVAQLRIINKLSNADTNAVYMIAEKLKQAVMEGSSAQIVMYTPMLTSSQNIAILSDSTIFDHDFYSKAMNMITSGPEYTGHNLAVLLKKLHDPASLDYVFDHFSKSENPRVRNLLISILQGFDQETDKTVRNKIIRWLREKRDSEKSALVRRSIRESVKRFNRNVESEPKR